ncbi:unnamed protein product [Symbiodinium sp. KB8]|nr:unnamed protein product [Symbiodinium sp. KB8]
MQPFHALLDILSELEDETDFQVAYVLDARWGRN